MPDWFWAACAMVLIVEGVGPLLIPRQWRNYVQSLSNVDVEQLRTVGGVLVVVGAVSLFFLV